MELSYSQNLEDYHLSLAFAGQASGPYIDVGAGHPIADNVSFWFYERGWHGIVVEPQPELAALYQRLGPRDVAVRGLIGRHCGEIDFHVVDRLHGLSTTVEELAQKAKSFGVDYQTVRMPVTTPGKLVRKPQSWLDRLPQNRRRRRGGRCSVGRRLDALSAQGDRRRGGGADGERAGMAGLGTVSCGSGLPLRSFRHA